MENERFQDLVLEHMVRQTQEITEVKNHLGSLDAKVGSLDTKLGRLETRVTKLETRVSKIEIVIENNIPQKFEALFDGQKQMVDQLNRIEKKLEQHDEIIFRRIK